MQSLKNVKMKKVENLLTSKEDISKLRISLEEQTEKAFNDFTKSKRKVQEIAREKYLY